MTHRKTSAFSVNCCSPPTAFAPPILGAAPCRLHMANRPPDLILLDVMMPEIDGYEVLWRLRDNPETANIPVIFVTALDTSVDEAHGLELGAVDYITKPIKPAITLARVKAHLDLKAARDWLADRNQALEAEVSRRMAENLFIQNVTIRCLGHPGGDPRPGDRQPPAPHATVCATAVRGTAPEPGFPRLPDRCQHRPAGALRTLARHRQGRHPGPHPAQARQADGRTNGPS
jgi:CheY-like chemotaxis protein